MILGTSVDYFVLQNNFEYGSTKIQLLDYILFPFICLVISLILLLFHVRNKNRTLEDKYFLPAGIAKLFGAFFITMMYNYYYKGGDTTAYFNDGRLLLNLLIYDPELGFEAFKVSSIEDASAPLKSYLEYFRFPTSSETWAVTKLSAISQIFSLQTFLNSALIFGFISFFPSWLLFKKFVSLFPKLYKQFAICFLFLPSVLVWGSGIMKDTITYASLALLFVCMHDFFISKKYQFWRVIIIVASTYFILEIKPYIYAAFIFPFVLYMVLQRLNLSKTVIIKKYIRPLILVSTMLLCLGLFFVFYSTVENFLMEMMINEIHTSQLYLSKGVKSGSAYDIGTFEPTLQGFINMAPISIQFVLYRPFLWESGNPIMLLAALESMFILVITIYALAKNWVLGFFLKILNNPITLFCIIFTLLFAIPVGIASGNYGTLVRYKIPCLPFYLAAMFILISNYKTHCDLTE